MTGTDATDRRNATASSMLIDASRRTSALLRGSGRSLWVFAALLLLVAAGAFALGRSSAPVPFDQQMPPHVGVPAHATLLRREDYPADHIQNWYYAVPGTSHEALTAFYRAQLSQDGWHCFQAMTSTTITQDGKAYSGSSVYMTALRGDTKAQIYTADQEYGAFLLQHDLPENALALKISLEVTDNTACA
jgi:hypothetical protein